MKYFSLLLFVCICALPAESVEAQTGKALGRIAKWAGKTIATSALESYVSHKIAPYFERDDNRTYSTYAPSFNLMITNNYPYNITYFWISTDGINWNPYMLYPNTYLAVSSGRAGVIGVFNGYTVQYFNQGGSFYASQFFY